MPLNGFPECPDRLQGEARKHFNFVSSELSAIGVTKRLDSEALAILADLWATYWECSEARDIDGMCKVVAKWSQLAGRFGLTPADRAKIMAGDGNKTDETDDRFFKVTG